MFEEVVVVIFVALTLQEGLDLGNFLSNSEYEDMAEMEGIEKVERETNGFKVKETSLEE